MPAINTAYVPFYNLEQIFLDKDTGEPLSGGIVTFYSDVNRIQLKPIYQITGEYPTYTFTQLPNPMVLSSIGTFVDEDGNPVVVYALPFDSAGDQELYYVTVYSADEAGDPAVFQLDVQATPYVNTQGDVIVATEATTQNQITNPQFVDVVFETNTSLTHTYTVTDSPQTTSIAPGWDIITNGAGTLTVTWVKSETGSQVTSPPYALTISTVGLASVATLRQTFNNTTNIFYGQYVYSSFVAQAGSASVNLILNYVTSGGVTQQLGAWTVPAAGGTLATYATSGGILITALNTQTQTDSAYINYDLVIEAGRTITLSSFQFLSVFDANAEIAFQQQTAYQQENNLFYYYNPLLQYKPIPSYLVGWDFALNPCQELGTTVSAQAAGANSAYYIADQTVLFQTVNSGISMTNSGGAMTFTAAQTTSFAIMQYLGLPEARELLRNPMAVQMVCTKTGTALAGRVDLYWTANAAAPVLPLSVVTSITAGVPAVTAGWTAVPRAEGTASFTPSTSTIPLSFSGFDATAVDTSAATFFAIVITFDTMTSTQAVAFQYVSLVQGLIPTRPAPQTPDEVLRECQYYYESSYNAGVVPGTAGAITGGSLIAMQTVYPFTGSGVALNMYPTSFGFPFKTTKRTNAPAVHTYSTLSGNLDVVQTVLFSNGAVLAGGETALNGNWSQATIGNKAVGFDLGSATPMLNPTTTPVGPSSYIRFQYIVDARIGKVV